MNEQSEEALLARVEQAIAWHQNGDLAGAETLYREIVASHPELSEIWRLLALIRHQADDPGLAFDYLQEAIRLDPENDVAVSDMRELGKACASGTLSGADHAATAALSATVEHIRSGQIDAARSTIVKARTLSPGNPEIAQISARIAFTRGDMDEARREQAASGYTGTAATAVSLRTYCERNTLFYRTLKPAGTMPACLPIPWHAESMPVPTIHSPEFGIGETVDVFFVGSHSALWTADGLTVNDLVARPDRDRFDFVAGPVKSAACGSFLIDSECRDCTIIERGIQMFGGGSFNFSHWIVEFLPRLASLSDAGEVYADWPLLVDEASLADPHQRELLDRLDTGRHPRIVLKSNALYRCHRLLVTTSYTSMPMNLKSGHRIHYGDVVISQEASLFVRKAFERYHADLPRRKLYLGRSGAGYRALRNEPEIRELFIKHGFEAVEPHRLSFEEKLALFGSAAIIGGPGSSAFTNIVFAPHDVRALFIVSAAWQEGCFLSTLAGHAGQRLFNQFGPIIAGSHALPYHSDYTADVEETAAALDKITSR